MPDIAQFTLPNGMRCYLLENHELPLVSGFAMVRTGNLFDPDGQDRSRGDHRIGDANRRNQGRRQAISSMSSWKTWRLRSRPASVKPAARVVFQCAEGKHRRRDGDLPGRNAEPRVSPGQNRSREDADCAVVFRGGTMTPATSLAVRLAKSCTAGTTLWLADGVSPSRQHSARRSDRASTSGISFPANIMLAVQGDFNTAEMRARIEKLFGDWNYKQDPVPAFPAVHAQSGARRLPGRQRRRDAELHPHGTPGRRAERQELSGLVGHGGHSRRRLLEPPVQECAHQARVSPITSVRGWGANYNHPGLFRCQAAPNRNDGRHDSGREGRGRYACAPPRSPTRNWKPRSKAF